MNNAAKLLEIISMVRGMHSTSAALEAAVDNRGYLLVLHGVDKERLLQEHSFAGYPFDRHILVLSQELRGIEPRPIFVDNHAIVTILEDLIRENSMVAEQNLRLKKALT